MEVLLSGEMLSRMDKMERLTNLSFSPFYAINLIHKWIIWQTAFVCHRLLS